MLHHIPSYRVKVTEFQKYAPFVETFVPQLRAVVETVSDPSHKLLDLVAACDFLVAGTGKLHHSLLENLSGKLTSAISAAHEKLVKGTEEGAVQVADEEIEHHVQLYEKANQTFDYETLPAQVYLDTVHSLKQKLSCTSLVNEFQSALGGVTSEWCESATEDAVAAMQKPSLAVALQALGCKFEVDDAVSAVLAHIAGSGDSAKSRSLHSLATFFSTLPTTKLSKDLQGLLAAWDACFELETSFAQFLELGEDLEARLKHASCNAKLRTVKANLTSAHKLCCDSPPEKMFKTINFISDSVQEAASAIIRDALGAVAEKYKALTDADTKGVFTGDKSWSDKLPDTTAWGTFTAKAEKR